jgi:hypothetical protein
MSLCMKILELYIKVFHDRFYNVCSSSFSVALLFGLYNVFNWNALNYPETNYSL